MDRSRWSGFVLEPLLLAFCVATATILGETAVLTVAEGHHLAELASQGEAFRLWGRYLLAFGVLGLGAGLLFLPLALAGERGRRAGTLALLAVLTVPTLWGTVSMRSGVLDVLARPTLQMALGGLGLAVAAWLAYAVLTPRRAPYVATVLLLLTGLLAAPAASTFGVQRLPSEVVSAWGLLALATMVVAGLTLAIPLALGLAARVPRLRPPTMVGVGLAVAFLALVASAPQWRASLPADAPRAAVGPSVLMIVTDTLRADAAMDVELAPNLATFAEDAVVWERAYTAAPWTIPSFASMMTSTLPSEHGAGRTDPSLGHKQRLRGDLASLAEVLQRKGWTTLAVLSNPTLSPRYGLDRGFDQYENLLNPQWYHPMAFGLRDRRLPRWLMPKELAYLRAPSQTRRILAAVDRARAVGGPFFILAHYMDPHEPYAAPETFQRAEDGFGEAERAYRAEVRYFDAELGRLLERLRERGLYDELLIVFASDHGQELAEERTDSQFLHGHTLYEEQIHVPLLVKLPNSDGGERRREPVSLVDVAPTILGRLGLAPPEGFRGRDLLAAPTDPGRVLFAEGMITPAEQKAALRGLHKVVATQVPPDAGDLERYDLARDPRERRPLSESPDAFGVLEDALLRHLEQASSGTAGAPAEGVVTDPALRQQLEALGYAE